jgi:hypothetical protein
MISFTTRPLYSLYRRLRGPQSRSGHCGKTKTPYHYRESNTGRPSHSASLYRLSYPGSPDPVYTSYIKHTETLLRKKDCCTYSLLLRNRMHSPIIKLHESHRLSGVKANGNWAEYLRRTSCSENLQEKKLCLRYKAQPVNPV